ncbi:GNAT family N-acetyltransferase [Pseudokineococcus sp. 1T1Z-3]|uniref:GNAT family N-acetyltransferase n=1 Tax=Pseudokineococcus sp. 1T1Z-3 TaxID=3132745 RepID=UPI00309E5E4A
MPLLRPQAEEYRRRTFAAQRSDPSRVYYRVARSGDDVVGFVHAEQPADGEPDEGPEDERPGGEEPDATLAAIYLLRAHQGTGVAERLMSGALAWTGGRGVRVEVASYNERAIAFYRRHGFSPTGATGCFRERVPTLHMRREPTA